MEDKICIKSMIAGRVYVNLPTIQRRFEWNRRGAIVKVNRDIFDVMSYDNGFTNMVKYGILFIEDMEVKKEMGLEPEDATEPVNLIELTEQRIKRMISVMPIPEFKGELKKLSEVQQREVANYMVNNNGSITMDRLQAMKDVCGIDVAQAIRMKQANEEKVDTKEG